MGYDITFHPIALGTLDIIKAACAGDSKPALAALLAGQTDAAAQLRKIVGAIEQGSQAADSGEAELAECLGLAFAALAGFYQPYWYARGSALSFFHQSWTDEIGHPDGEFLDRLFTPWSRVLPGLWRQPIDDGVVSGNYSGAGFIYPATVRDLRGRINSGLNLDDVFDEESLLALQACLDHCVANDLGLTEASEVFSPLEGSCVSYAPNLRAKYQ